MTIDNSDLPDVPAADGGGSTVTVDDVTEAMKDVVDPELGINVVDGHGRDRAARFGDLGQVPMVDGAVVRHVTPPGLVQ